MSHRKTRFTQRCFAAATFVFALAALAPRAAEPDVDSSDLPRIPPKTVVEALSTFQLRSGLRIEPVAAEPLVIDPIAMCFDENGRLFVVEMRDYSERRDERLGRIRLLEDLDGDGKMDRATVFAENLPWPTGLLWFNGGLFVASTPDILYLKDSDGDGKSDQTRIVFSGFGASVPRLNVQQLLNSLTWGLDNRVHAAAGGNGGIVRTPEHPERPPVDLRNADFSFDPRTLELRLENGGGQYGLTFDNFGRKFVCSNSAHIRQVIYERAFVTANMTYAVPPATIDIPVDGPAGPVYRTSPDEPWRVLRTKWRVNGLVPGPIESGKPSGFFTGASGLMIYRGDAIPQMNGDAIVADVGSNLVHRKKLHPNGVAFLAERAPGEEKRELLTSSDLWFRPVSFCTGPDGALYIADMYREVIEHPWSLPPNLKKHLDLNSGNTQGRIYRIVPDDFKQPPQLKLGTMSGAELVGLLAHPNGWVRDNASRLLFERGDLRLVAQLRAQTNSPLAWAHALGVLFGLRALEREDVERASLAASADLREVALRFALYAGIPVSKGTDESPRVRHQLAWTLAQSASPETKHVLEEMLARATDNWERHAIKAALSVDPSLATQAKPLRAEPALARAPSRQNVVEKFAGAADLSGDPGKGKEIFLQRCALCHRKAGEGKAVGPDLESIRTAGKPTMLANIVDPNREIPLRFVTYEITTRDGNDYSGILAAESANGLTLLQPGGAQQFIPRTQIETFKTTGRSLMPDGLEDGLTQEAMADLLAFLSQ